MSTRIGTTAMEPLAIVSDIHGNLEAFQAVLRDIDRTAAKNVYSLGDVIGAPDALECLRLTSSCTLALSGDYERVLLGESSEATQTEPRVRDRIRRVGRELSRARTDAVDWLDVVRHWPEFHVEGRAAFVHGSLRRPTAEYVFAEDVYNPRKMDHIFERIDRVCFCGHTHVPGIIEQRAIGEYAFFTPEEVKCRYRLGEHKVICNVGSVGLPRDGDLRASYVLFVGDAIEFRRVSFDQARFAQKLEKWETQSDH
jgi:predicted phosphodiesterase